MMRQTRPEGQVARRTGSVFEPEKRGYRRLRTIALSARASSVWAKARRCARPASFRLTITLERQETRVLVKQTTVVDPHRLGRSAGRLDADELRSIDEVLMLVLAL